MCDHTDARRVSVSDASLQPLIDCGIAYHHGGVEVADRRIIEDAFRAGQLHVIVCTSTLAVGVNLPAHLVIVKGTQMWTGAQSGFRDYTDIEIQQMIGRAGRPQYDTSAMAVIMCDKHKKGYVRLVMIQLMQFDMMVNSRTVVESCLLSSLVERESYLGELTQTSTARLASAPSRPSNRASNGSSSKSPSIRAELEPFCGSACIGIPFTISQGCETHPNLLRNASR